ncbi:disulfide bond formation protein B [Pelagibacteraceae bacterium]|jgi:disulfide bond formation protein DsbB|nr:disulfide bond formation protein B [Pelagibacteraceae bacterium]
MLKVKNNIFLIFLLFAISIAFVIALIIQYGFGHQPCRLCVYQRIPYILSILLLVSIFIIKKYKKITLLLLAIIFFLSFSLGFYHFGIEQGFFNELSVCGVDNFKENLTKKQLLKNLEQSAVSCKDVNFKILGLSLATINSIFSLLLSGIFLRLFLIYGKN